MRYLHGFIFSAIIVFGTAQVPINALCPPGLKTQHGEALKFIKNHPILTGITAGVVVGVTAGCMWKGYKVIQKKLVPYIRRKSASQNRTQHENKCLSFRTIKQTRKQEKQKGRKQLVRDLLENRAQHENKCLLYLTKQQKEKENR